MYYVDVGAGIYRYTYNAGTTTTTTTKSVATTTSTTTAPVTYPPTGTVVPFDWTQAVLCLAVHVL